MKNVALCGKLSQVIFNETQKYAELLSKPQQYNFREIMRGIFISGSTYLSQIGKANGASKNERKTVERLSRTLEKIPTEAFAEIHVKSQVHHYQDEAVLILSDGGDFQKPYAKKMEKVCKTVDGSRGHTVGKGYPIHSLMILGLESEDLNPLAVHPYSTLDDTFESSWHEEQKNFELLHPLIKSSKYDRIIVEDRGCDDEKRFLYFVNDLECSFVTRINAGTKSRNLLVQNRDGEFETIKVNDLAQELKVKAGSQRTWRNNKIKADLNSTIAFEKVYLPEHSDIPLYAIFCYTEGFKEPLVILTDLTTENFDKAWTHFFYYKKRWEVENFYRAIKQQFGAEEFLIQDFEKIKALTFAVMLSYYLLLKIKRGLNEFLGLIYHLFVDFCQRKQKSGHHHLDVLAFLRDYFAQSELDNHYRFYSRRFRKFLYPSTKNQLQLFNLRKIW